MHESNSQKKRAALMTKFYLTIPCMEAVMGQIHVGNFSVEFEKNRSGETG